MRADVTVTMHGRKVGLEVAPGRFQAGEVVVADIGLEQRETAHPAGHARRALRSSRAKRSDDNKYTAGAVLVVGGSPGMTGAACLAATAAFRADAGYVTVAAPRESLPVIESRVLEAVKRPLEEAADAGRAPRRARARPGARPRRRASARSSAGCSRRSTCPRSSTRTPSSGSSRSSARRRPCSPRTRASSARLLGRESAWVDAHRLEAVQEGGGAVRLRLPAEGRRRARRRAGRGPARRGARPAVACDRRHGGRADGRDARSSPRESTPGSRPPPRRSHATLAARRGPARGLVASDVVALLPAVLGESGADAPV